MGPGELEMCASYIITFSYDKSVAPYKIREKVSVYHAPKVAQTRLEPVHVTGIPNNFANRSFLWLLAFSRRFRSLGNQNVFLQTKKYKYVYIYILYTYLKGHIYMYTLNIETIDREQAMGACRCALLPQTNLFSMWSVSKVGPVQNMQRLACPHIAKLMQLIFYIIHFNGPERGLIDLDRLPPGLVISQPSLSPTWCAESSFSSSIDVVGDEGSGIGTT